MQGQTKPTSDLRQAQTYFFDFNYLSEREQKIGANRALNRGN
jgi:hypothetical protein